MNRDMEGKSDTFPQSVYV